MVNARIATVAAASFTIFGAGEVDADAVNANNAVACANMALLRIGSIMYSSGLLRWRTS
jgi:hypothetical protein